jgi:hypothetical protein
MQILDLLKKLGIPVDFLSLAGYYQALTPFMSMKAADISPLIVKTIIAKLGLKASDEQVVKVTECLRTSDLDTLADMLSNEQVAMGMVKLLQPPNPQTEVDPLDEGDEVSPFVEDCGICHTPISARVGYCSYCR